MKGRDGLEPMFATAVMWMAMMCLGSIGAETEDIIDDSIVMTCHEGNGVGEYTACIGDGWPTPIEPRCFGLAADKSVYLVDTDTRFRLRIHRFDATGQPLVSYLLPETVYGATAIAIAPSGEMYVAADGDGSYILDILPNGVIRGRIGRQGLMSVGDGEKVNRHVSFGWIPVLLLDQAGLLQVIHCANSVIPNRMLAIDRDTQMQEGPDTPLDPVLEGQFRLLDERKTLLRERGKQVHDAKLDADGSLWYMTYGAEVLAIHKVTFSDENALPDECTGPEQ